LDFGRSIRNKQVKPAHRPTGISRADGGFLMVSKEDETSENYVDILIRPNDEIIMDYKEER